MRRYWLLTLMLCFMLIPTTSAQEGELGWLLEFLPTVDDSASMVKLLSTSPTPLMAGELLLDEDFTAINAWENFRGENQRAVVEDGGYEIVSSLENSRMWGQGSQSYSNVAISVETEQLSDEPNNGYGVSCRGSADNIDSDGYYFYISGDGFHSIFKIQNGDVTVLEDWVFSEVINQGQGAQNRIVAVCYRDYLALYANDVLLAEARDTDRTEGIISLAATLYEANSTVHMRFDNLQIYSVTGQVGEDPVVATSTSATPEPTPDTSDISNARLNLLLRTGTRNVTADTLLANVTFGDSGAWGTYSDNEGNSLNISNGSYNAYIVEGGGTIFWGLSDTDYSDVVIQVDAAPSDSTTEAAYGIACRADEDSTGRGYYLIIGTEGYYALLISNGDNYIPAVEDYTDAIDFYASTTLTVVCAGSYLALFNGNDLIFEYEDNKFPEGRIGLTVAAYGIDGEIVDVRYDNLRIWSASLGN